MAGRKKISQRRGEQRERLAPGSGEIVWPQAGEDGWGKTPRTMSIILRILGEKAVSGDADLVGTYLDLWDRNMGEGLVELRSDAEHACVAGFGQSRGPRTWRERLDRLADLGFVQVHPRGPVKYGYIIIVHPHRAVRGLRDQGLVPDELWNLLVERAEAVGADMDLLRDRPPAEVVRLRARRSSESK